MCLIHYIVIYESQLLVIYAYHVFDTLNRN